MKTKPVILGISGSPRVKGNTDILLDHFLGGAEKAGAKTEKIYPAKLAISPCRECMGCEKTGKCVVDDAMQEIYPRLLNCDILVVASPLFFMGPTAQLKGLIDRTQALWVGKYKLGKAYRKAKRPRYGYLLGVGAIVKNWDTFKGLKLAVKSMFVTLDVEYRGDVLVTGIDARGEINGHAVLDEAFSAGAALVKQWRDDLGSKKGKRKK